jgi:hypothetical protein
MKKKKKKKKRGPTSKVLWRKTRMATSRSGALALA